MEVECLIPGREYWILVDGEGSLIDPDLQIGIFDIEVYADFKLFGRLLKTVLSKKLEKNLLENIKDLILLIDSGFTINKHTTDENSK